MKRLSDSFKINNFKYDFDQDMKNDRKNEYGNGLEDILDDDVIWKTDDADDVRRKYYHTDLEHMHYNHRETAEEENTKIWVLLNKQNKQRVLT